MTFSLVELLGSGKFKKGFNVFEAGGI